MENNEIINSLKKEMDEIKQKPLNKPEVYIMSWNEKYQLDNKILCLEQENSTLHDENKKLKEQLFQVKLALKNTINGVPFTNEVKELVNREDWLENER